MQLHLLTGNPFKIDTAELALRPYGIEVHPVSLNLPEIQADSNEEIARDAALKAAKLLRIPVAREDHGFYLDAFPGFPGPYMAQIETKIPPEDALRLLEGKVRTGYFSMALAYATPAGELIEFAYQLPCTLAKSIRPGNKDFSWDSIICLGDEDRTLSEYPQKQRHRFFTQNFTKLAERL